MEEARLNHLLRGLPREMARAGFTTQVLQRLDETAETAETDEPARAAVANHPRHGPRPLPWQRLMMATATVAALGVSVGVSVGLLQRERLAPSPVVQLARASAAVARGSAGTARMTLTAAAMDRTFRHEGAAELPALGLGPRRAAIQPGVAALGAARAHQMWRELQLESGQLERELRSLRQPGHGTPSGVLYLGGDDSVDLVLNTGRTRVPGPPQGERDDGENFDYL